MSRVAFTCLLKQKLKFCSSLTHIFDEKKVSIFFKNKPVWRIFSPGFMFSEMNLWKFRHYFWQFRHYFWKLDFSSTLMLKLMETLFVKLLCRTPETVRNFALKVLNLDHCGEKLKQVPISQSWILSTAPSSLMQTHNSNWIVFCLPKSRYSTTACHESCHLKDPSTIRFDCLNQ